MPITVIKKPEWRLFYYHLQGICTSAELVQALEYGTSEPIPRAVAIFDFLDGDLDVEVQDISKVIKINKQLYERGLITTHGVVLTQNRTIQLLVNAIELLSFKEQIELKIFNTLDEGITWLNLSEHEAEIHEIREHLGSQNN